MNPPSSPCYISPTSSPARKKSKSPPYSPREDIPSKTMTTAQYLRLHANASPTKLRAIIKDIIFVHDDVEYLKRLVRDVGGMDYVFRFLWYDGPVPASVGDGSSGRSGVESFPAGGAKQSQAHNNHSSNKGAATTSQSSGRSWIQHCCYHNAHQCLRWIFQEIVRNHLCKQQQYREEQRLKEMSSSLTMNSSERQTSAADADGSGAVNETDSRDEQQDNNTNDNEDPGNLVKIIQQLLEFPSSSYCGINYIAVATLRNSHECLSLLLKYGGLDPNMPINIHGATAAHLAAWKDHVECLRVLQSGTYACRFDDDDGGFSEELSMRSTITGESDNDDGSEGYNEFSSRWAFSSLLAASSGQGQKWGGDWTRTNALGETPLHVAAREGCLDSMQFFLDLAVTSAMSSLEEELEKGDDPCTIDFSIRNNDGMDCAAVAAKHDQAGIVTLIWETIERLLDSSMDGPLVISSPAQQSFASPVPKDYWQNTLQSKDFWQHTLSYFQPKVEQQKPDFGSSLPPKPPPESPKSPSRMNRRRVKSEPFNTHTLENPSPAGSLPQAPPMRNHQQCLPHNFPSLNLRNSLDKHNHEMPIHTAAHYGNCAAIEALFKSGNCDTTARDSLGQTALHIAAEAGHVNACQLFVHMAGDEFENFDVVDILGRTPLYIACSMGNSSLARILASASNWRVICHERKKSPFGPLYEDVAHHPPLHAAVVNDHVNTVSEMLDCGVDVDQTDPDGRTAISVAAKLGYLDMCQKLILNGANVNTRSTRGGRTPYQKAKKYKHQDVADLLYEFGGR